MLKTAPEPGGSAVPGPALAVTPVATALGGVFAAATLPVAPGLGLYGGQDSGIGLDTVEQMKAALATGSAAAQASQVVVYPDVPHAFYADYRPGFRKDAADDGWRRCLAWMYAHGAAPHRA